VLPNSKPVNRFYTESPASSAAHYRTFGLDHEGKLFSPPYSICCCVDASDSRADFAVAKRSGAEAGFAVAQRSGTEADFAVAQQSGIEAGFALARSGTDRRR